MADLTALKDVDYSGGTTISIAIADAVSLYPGTLVGMEGGYANHWADGANDLFCGIVETGDDYAATTRYNNTFTGDAAGNKRGQPRVIVRVGATLLNQSSVIGVNGGAIAQTDVGKVVYCADSDPDSITVETTGGTHPIGYVADFHSATKVDIKLFTPSEARAQATA